MSAAIWHLFGLTSPMARLVDVPDYNSNALVSTVAIQRLPSEPVGTFALTLANVVVGSAIRVETQAGAAIEFRTATGPTEVFNVPAYGFGDAANNLRIKVRKGSAAPFYQPYETQATAFVGSQSVFVAQTPD